MGAFTHDLAVCDQFYRADVPVWLIRPYSALHSIRIMALKPLTKAVNILLLELSSRPTYPLSIADQVMSLKNTLHWHATY
jgi:hypothetical protein